MLGLIIAILAQVCLLWFIWDERRRGNRWRDLCEDTSKMAATERAMRLYYQAEATRLQQQIEDHGPATCWRCLKL